MRIIRIKRTAAVLLTGVVLVLGIGVATPVTAGPIVEPSDGINDPVGTAGRAVGDLQSTPGDVYEEPCVQVRYYFFRLEDRGEQTICPIPKP